MDGKLCDGLHSCMADYFASVFYPASSSWIGLFLKSATTGCAAAADSFAAPRHCFCFGRLHVRFAAAGLLRIYFDLVDGGFIKVDFDHLLRLRQRTTLSPLKQLSPYLISNISL
jgi:hypothetical protein